jgi:arylsulfatase A-like enzyme
MEDAPAPLLPSEPATEPLGVARRLNRRLQRIRPAMGPLRMIYDELYFRYCQRSTPVAASLDGLRRFPSADVIVDYACQWLTSIGDAPCFLWLHLMDSHSPYYPKEEALALLGRRPVTPYQARYLNSYWNRSDLGPLRLARRREEVVALYDAGIRWVDVQIARLTQSLKQLNRWDDCVFALTADHGEEFLDHGGRYHPPSKLMEELIHVPLLLRAPGASGNAGANNTPFSLIHLAPTLLDAAQLPVPPEFQGRSYWQRAVAAGHEIAISESVANCTNPFRPENRLGPRVLSVRESQFKLMLFFDPPEEYLYDLAADPGEQSPLAPTAHKAVRRRLLETAREHVHRSVEQRNWQMRVRARLQELRLEWSTPLNHVSAAAS